jgi:hypothetical protein
LGNGVGLVRNGEGVSFPLLLSRLPKDAEPYVYL